MSTCAVITVVRRDVWARAHAWLLFSVRDVLQEKGCRMQEGNLRGEVILILTKPFDTKETRNYSFSKIVEVTHWQKSESRSPRRSLFSSIQSSNRISSSTSLPWPRSAFTERPARCTPRYIIQFIRASRTISISSKCSSRGSSALSARRNMTMSANP
ncbi:hypothetical protein B0H11DRAFT_2036204 [Mycena galericulata]|nr:hypothetical protein B0H11DRAFT_2036204 [Mycena galericulata]